MGNVPPGLLKLPSEVILEIVSLHVREGSFIDSFITRISGKRKKQILSIIQPLCRQKWPQKIGLECTPTNS